MEPYVAWYFSGWSVKCINYTADWSLCWQWSVLYVLVSSMKRLSWTHCLLHNEIKKNSIFNRHWIYRKAQVIMHLSRTAFHEVSHSPDSTSQDESRFYKGVSLLMFLLSSCCFCFDLWYVVVHVCCLCNAKCSQIVNNYKRHKLLKPIQETCMSHIIYCYVII